VKYPNNYKCPKCSGWKSTGVTGGNVVTVEMVKDRDGERYTPYVCPKCGLTEWYKEDL
jgi:predicted RNA-binding Zn-ribbon protein involved in translation (DUF1610 family)